MKYKKNVLNDNLFFALLYWGISHLNWLIFSNMGVLPMPIWPAAGMAFVGAFYRGWSIAPGIVIGAFLANYISLGAPLEYALLIPVMNTIGPLTGGWIARKILTPELIIEKISDVFLLFISGLVITPMLTATGGIGFKWVLRLISPEEMMTAWLKWGVAHSVGTLLIGIPLFAWIKMHVKP